MELHIWSSAKVLLLSVAMMIIINLRFQHASAANYLRNQTDEFALLELKRQISRDPHGVLSSWNHSLHHCRWQGVTCDARHRRVLGLTLQGKELFGSISPHIGNLSFLKFIELEENKFYGEIPREIGHLFRLRYLNVTTNSLSGEIPVNLSYCTELRTVSAKYNRFTGQVPKELGSLKKLVTLRLSYNNFTGNIPSSLGNLSSLNFISLSGNNLEGHLPNELGMLINLSYFLVYTNLLTGTLPPYLFNISTLKFISISQNFFHGNLPEGTGLKLPNLQVFDSDSNQLSGTIPDSITNATKLEFLALSANKLQGQVPKNLGNLPHLQWLNVEGNLLGKNSAEDLSFISSLTNCSRLRILSFDENNFGGELPKIVANLSSHLQLLYMGGNHISGSIPMELGNLVNLYLLSMEMNSFSGTIPRNFGGMQNLQVLALAENMLSGLIPPTLYNITSLYDLQLQNNFLEGKISPRLGNCRKLQILKLAQNKLAGAIPGKIFLGPFSLTILDLSHNSLTGSLPAEIGSLKNLNSFNVSHNNLSGEIPRAVGDCLSLEYLNMEGNSFRGAIPSTLASLKGMQHLDLSQNKLTGQILRDLEGLLFLKYLNLSFNDLEGEVPTNGIFGNARLVSLVGNNKLCGGIAELGFHSCHVQRKNNRRILVIIIVSSVLSAVILISALLLFCYLITKRRKRSSTMPSRDDKFMKVSFQELHHATAGFSPENLIGSGSFGFVYKGRLDKYGHEIVAIKVLDLHKNGASKSFKAECRALRHVRHRNLVPILTSCSSIDWKGQEFKALVYEFMENGSLDSWLHPELAERKRSRMLNLVQRLNIAIDVASAMHYLHNHTEVPIVHCDLKPSNILLGNELIARVSDFGLARLLFRTTKQWTSSTVAIKGTIGYVAPEYGIGSEVSTAGDVYSYGIFLLEIFTGRRPIDDIFTDGLDLPNFVKMNFPQQVMKITDPSLGEANEKVEPKDVVVDDDLQKCLISIFRIGLKCSTALPKDRMNMSEVITELLHIKDANFGTRNKRAIH